MVARVFSFVSIFRRERGCFGNGHRRRELWPLSRGRRRGRGDEKILQFVTFCLLFLEWKIRNVTLDISVFREYMKDNFDS